MTRSPQPNTVIIAGTWSHSGSSMRNSRHSQEDDVEHHPAHPDVLSPAGVAERLGLSEETVLRLLADGTLPGRKLTDEWRIYWPAVVASFRHDPAADVIRAPDL